MNPLKRRVDERLRGCRQNRRPCKLSRIDVRTVAGHIDAWRRRGLGRGAAIRVRNADAAGRAVWLTAKEVRAIRPAKASIIDDQAGGSGPVPRKNRPPRIPPKMLLAAAVATVIDQYGGKPE